MKIVLALFLLTFVAACGVSTRVQQSNPTAILQSHNERICMLAGFLTSEYKFVNMARIIAAKGSYGPVEEILSAMADEGRRMGADAIIGLQSSQRFGGPFPWRFTRPVGDGMAIKLTPDSPRIDCPKLGGNLF